MAKRSVPKQPEIPDDACPRCWKKKGKIVRRSIDRMAYHYTKKHPGKKLPDRFYTGPRDAFGQPINPYVGKFTVGARVRLRGFFKKGTHAYMSDGRMKDGRHFLFYPEFEGYMEDGVHIIGKKGTVYDISPLGNSGHPMSPPVVHVKLDKPIVLKYGDKHAVSVLERELKILKPKVEDEE